MEQECGDELLGEVNPRESRQANSIGWGGNCDPIHPEVVAVLVVILAVILAVVFEIEKITRHRQVGCNIVIER